MKTIKTPGGRQWLLLGITVLLMTPMSMLRGDEGMWLYNDPPRQRLKERYQFEPTDAWLKHLRESSVRFNSGGSGSFVSEDGLLISNHHVGSDDLHKLSDAEHDYVRDGFLARSLAEEKKCLDLELNVLVGIEDVTERVNAAVQAGASAEEASAARRAVMAAIEKESLEKTGLRSDVVTLYQGGQYHLYRFKRYTDVRLVFAPEQQIAFFGGDPDNFEYPRFNLDVCLFRAYENGQPAKVPHYLRWSRAGVAEGELVFVSGHPGSTSRQLTVAELESLRDERYPQVLARLNRLEVLLAAWSARSAENARRAKDLLFGVQNSRKARLGRQAGLLDPRLMAAKRDAEEGLKKAMAGRAEWKEALGAWEAIAQAQREIGRVAVRHGLLEGAQGFHSTLFQIARHLLRAPVERAKPNGERLREYRDSNKESLELGLFSEQPIYDDLETLLLADSLAYLAENLGAGDGLVQRVLAGKSPRARASELVRETRVKEVALRRALYGGTPEEVQARQDPMIELARLVDEEARRLRKVVEAQDEIKKQAYAKIAAARFAIEKTGSYPDATFTLRLAYGAARGYEEDGKKVPYQTTLAGLYERAAAHEYAPPFHLPRRWLERKDRLELATPFNFVCTADIIGGNSGSPVVNRQGEFVGIIFDGNIHSLVLDFLYTEEQARAVSVNSQAIIEALHKVYDAPWLADELLNGKRGS